MANTQTDEELRCRVARVTKTESWHRPGRLRISAPRPPFLVHRIQIVAPRNARNSNRLLRDT